MQLMIDEFFKLTGRYPKYDKFTNIIPLVCSTASNIASHATNEIAPLLSNEDGWLYDETTSQIRINYSGKYFVDFQSWVDLSKISPARQLCLTTSSRVSRRISVRRKPTIQPPCSRRRMRICCKTGRPAGR